MGLTGFAEKEETPVQKRQRLKTELIQTIEQLWYWAEKNKAYGSLEISVPLEDGIPQRLIVAPRQITK